MTDTSCLLAASLQPEGFPAAAAASVSMYDGTPPDHAGPTEARGHSRSNLFIGAVLDFGAKSAPIRIRNISASGALIQGNDLPSAGATIHLRRGSQSTIARVVRSDGSRAGVAFVQKIEIGEWLPSADQAHQDATDRRLAQAKAVLASPSRAAASPSPPHVPTPSLAPSPAGRFWPQPEEQELSVRISEEMTLVSRMLEAIGEDLANNPIIVGRHGVSLQRLDESARVLMHLAAATASNDPLSRVKEIDMHALQRRLLRRSL